MKKILLLSLFTFTTLAGHADEGMWMLTDLKEQNAATMYDMGLDISIDKVYCPDSISLKDAVVISEVVVPVKSFLPKVLC